MDIIKEILEDLKNVTLEELLDDQNLDVMKKENNKMNANSTPSIYDIKYNTIEKSPYFFSVKTMKFFNQTLRSFKVKKSPSGRIFIYAPMADNTGAHMGYTFREYVDNNLKMVYNTDGSMFNHNSLTDIINYIQEN